MKVWILGLCVFLLTAAAVAGQRRCVNGVCYGPVASYPQQYSGKAIVQPTLRHSTQSRAYMQQGRSVSLTSLLDRIETLEKQVEQLSAAAEQ